MDYTTITVQQVLDKIDARITAANTAADDAKANLTDLTELNAALSAALSTIAAAQGARDQLTQFIATEF